MSRTILLCFKQPEIGTMATIEEQELWDDIHLMMEAASSSVGMAISLGKALDAEGGFKAIRDSYIPFVQESLQNVQPRVISGYATLLWFTEKVPELELVPACHANITHTSS